MERKFNQIQGKRLYDQEQINEYNNFTGENRYCHW